MKSLDELNWDTILNYLEHEQAALFIGPDILQFEGKNMSLALRDSLEARFRSQILYYYREDGLFLFSDDIAKTDAAQYVRQYISEHQPDNALFLKIAQIKFPLVVSLNPDTYLSDLCYQYGIRHRFSYFKSKSKATEDVEEPSKDLPLLYNLCGSKNEDESIILDYEDLFRLISSSVGSPGLPNKLKVALEKVRLYFFVGFSFEKWYTQLLLRLLCGEKKSRKYASGVPTASANTLDFLMHQFQIEFLEQGESFIQALYQQCSQRQLLRDISLPGSAESADIIRHLQTGKDLFNVFELMRRMVAGSPQADDVTLLMSTYNTLLEEKKKGVLDSRDYFMQHNRIIDGILSILNEKPGPTQSASL